MRRSAAVLMLASVLLVSTDVPSWNGQVFAAEGQSKPTSKSDSNSSLIVNDLGAYYQEVLDGWRAKGYKDGTQQITVQGADIKAQSDNKLAQAGAYEGKPNVLVWRSDKDNWIEYQVDVPEDGLYEMSMSYHPLKAQEGEITSKRAIVLSVQLDGSFPFREARSIAFHRKFKDEFPLKKDVNGDNIRPRPIELNEWMTESFEDTSSAYADPFQWYLGKGKHTLRLSGSEPVAIESIAIKPQTALLDYAQVSAKYPQGETKGNLQVIQAEEAAWKDDVAIGIDSVQEPFMTPKANGDIIFNSIGGTKWQNGGQTIGWTIEVPESGRYQIAGRTYQGFSSNMSVFRSITIDGKVPFKEMQNYAFPFSTYWKGTVLGDSKGKPYDFYLEKGKHTLTMTATIAPFQPVILLGEQAINKLRQVDEEIRALTGGNIDKDRTWKIEQDFPEILKQVEDAKEQLNKMAEAMLAANGRRDNSLQTIETAAIDLTDYLKYPDEITYHMADISSLIDRVSAIRETLIKSPLQLDQLYIVPSGSPLPKMEANLWQKMNGMIHNFFYSFIKKDDINQVDDGTLNVWVNRGRDYVNLLQELTDEMFTPETGIKVKVNLLPSENLLIYANAAGLSPDIALGQPQDKSIDFAMRNALLDLSSFPDFDKVAKDFAPGALLPFYYNKGYYALPETQSYKVLFYRKDILNRLNVKVPDTWNDVYDMLPTLQQNGYNFYLTPTDYLPFFYQNNADFYTKDGMKTALSTPEAIKGFKQWTDLFNIYDFEKSVPSFFQHFRQGDMPIGIADYNTYITLAAAAPELTGWWGIAPVPGVKQSDGIVSRWAAGGQTTGFIYKSSKHKEESWKYLKWLLSAEVQERYGSDLESFNGISFRWNTANIKAFTHLPWPKEDMNVILEQWKWYREQANLPGSYMLTRELNNAWNRTVVDGMNARESLEEAILNIDREMVRKEQEFGFVDGNGKVLHTLDLPQITKPWEGVNPYVTK